MANSCSIKAHVRNSKGEIVESRLFNDLLHYTSNDRAVTKENYAVATNSKFLNLVRDKAQFDENGEITFKSYSKLSKLNIKKEKIKQILKKDLKEGNYSYEEALAKVVNFNKNNPYSEDFIATLSHKNDGTYDVFITKSSPKSKDDLRETIKNKSLQDKLIYLLKRYGVDVSFLENAERYNGRYSTVNATQTSEGLYQLIKISRGENSDNLLAEEAGHFVVGAMGKHPLVERLMNVLTPEVQKQILGEVYDGKTMGDSAKREIAGMLVGKSLINQNTDKTVWEKLSNRISKIAKKIFATIKGDEVTQAIMEAEKIADQMASQFNTETLEGSVENALAKQETLFNAVDSIEVKTYREVLGKLKLQAAEIRGISEDAYNKFQSIANAVEMGKDVNTADIFADNTALQGIAEAVTAMSDLYLYEIPELLNMVHIDFDDPNSFVSNVVRNSKALRIVHIYTQTAMDLIETINSVMSGIPGAESLKNPETITSVDRQGHQIIYNLKQIVKELNEIVRGGGNNTGLYDIVFNHEKQFFIQYLQNIYGNKYISRAARVIFNFKGGPILQFKAAKDYSISELVTEMESDISFYERFIASMSNNSDVVGQIIDKGIKSMKVLKKEMVTSDQKKLLQLEEEFKILKKLKLISNTRELYETITIIDENGKERKVLTGNFIDKLSYGKWEKDFQEFKKSCIEVFKSTYPDVDNYTEADQARMWHDFFDPEYKAWHKSHSDRVLAPDGISYRLIPKGYDSSGSELYINEDYKHLPSKVIDLINKLKAFKQDQDEKLGDGHGVNYRTPQFKGVYMDRLKNNLMSNNLLSALNKTNGSIIRDTFCESSEDRDYGSNDTYNSESEELFHHKIAFEKEKINRLPLYGINKLDNMEELSTDIFGSLLAYSDMASQYFVTSNLVDACEVGKNVLQRRKIEGITTEDNQKANKSRAYNRLLKYYDKQLYGISAKKVKLGKKIVLNKIIQFLNIQASKLYMGGNVPGGLVNIGTGTIEMFKEGLSGEYFSTKDLLKANSVYFKYLPSNLWDSTKQVDDGMINLFIQHFDILNDNETKWKDYNSRQNRLWTLTKDSLWFPYKTGEHYMQTLPYLALALKQTVFVEKNGELVETNLWNAYTSKKVDSTKNHFLELEGLTFKSKEEAHDYHMVEDMINQINTVINQPFSLVSQARLNFSAKQQQYLVDNSISLNDLNEAKKILEVNLDTLHWGMNNEIQFRIKAQEICNRMHGIYNSLDKTAVQQSILGDMMFAMKGYALGMMERRFGSSKYNLVTEGETGGSISDALKVLVYAGIGEGGFGHRANTLLSAIFLPVIAGESTKKKMIDAGFSEHQYRNMRRNFGDILMIVALSLIKGLTAKGGDDDDDKKGKAQTLTAEQKKLMKKYHINLEPESEKMTSEETFIGIAYYMSSRLLREQQSFNTLKGAKDEFNNLLDFADPVCFSAASDIYHILTGLIGQNFVDEDSPNYNKYYYSKTSKGVYEKGQSKAERKALRMFPYLRSYFIFAQPYEAAASYDYGRKVNN